MLQFVKLAVVPVGHLFVYDQTDHDGVTVVLPGSGVVVQDPRVVWLVLYLVEILLHIHDLCSTVLSI